jgi:hypothetical protein
MVIDTEQNHIFDLHRGTSLRNNPRIQLDHNKIGFW